MNKKIGIIIPAGGSGNRFGGQIKKQFLNLENESLLARSIKPFLSIEGMLKIVVALPESHLADDGLLQHENIFYVAGGGSRAESVYNGYQELSELSEDDLVLVHDAARPFLSEGLIQRVIDGALKNGAAIPGLTVSDTIKVVDAHNKIIDTPVRSDLRAVQTPQGFRYGLLKKAYESIDFRDSRYTDESMLVEALGESVVVVEGAPENLKITQPFDFRVAEEILNARKGES